MENRDVSRSFSRFQYIELWKTNANKLKIMGPEIAGHSFKPKSPGSKDSIVVRARVESKIAEIESVAMHYRRMFGREYTVPMHDDGRFPDNVANDGVFTAVIPDNTARSGEMIRWYITAADNQGNKSRDPGFHDHKGNRHDPQYHGTMFPDIHVKSRLPILYWFSEDPKKGHTRDGTRGCVYYEGVFYDNIYVRQRGRSTNKRRSQKFVFNRGHEFYVNARLGKVSEFNLNGPGMDASYLRQPIGFENYRRNGIPASACFLIRVQTNGKFDRVGIFIEQVDRKFLQRNGYDENGALYKFVQRDKKPVFKDLNGVEKKTRQWEDASDLQAVIDNLVLKDKEKHRKFLMNHFDLPQLINRLAIMIMHREVDSIRKNFYLYHDTQGSGRWSMFPWDLDLLFGNTDPGEFAGHPYLGDRVHPLHPQKQWSVLLDVVYSLPDFRAMFLRRLRTLMDDYLQAPDTPDDKRILESRIDAFYEKAKTDLRLKHKNIDRSIKHLKRSVQKRRIELFMKYGELIPKKQTEDIEVRISKIVFPTFSSDTDEEYISIFNPNDTAVDMSRWQLTGAVNYTFTPGTVLPKKSGLYVSQDVKAFLKRQKSHGKTACFVQGPYLGFLKNADEPLELKNSMGRLIAVSELPVRSEPGKTKISWRNNP